jgi:hypothetical protein
MRWSRRSFRWRLFKIWVKLGLSSLERIVESKVTQTPTTTMATRGDPPPFSMYLTAIWAVDDHPTSSRRLSTCPSRSSKPLTSLPLFSRFQIEKHTDRTLEMIEIAHALIKMVMASQTITSRTNEQNFLPLDSKPTHFLHSDLFWPDSMNEYLTQKWRAPKPSHSPTRRIACQ